LIYSPVPRLDISHTIKISFNPFISSSFLRLRNFHERESDSLSSIFVVDVVDVVAFAIGHACLLKLIGFFLLLL
jgi:hypothetical protein